MKTLKEIRGAIVDDLDLGDEDYISTPDLNRWINNGIEKAERIIHTLYEDYFLSVQEKSITEGQQYIDYPSDIYANKIRKMIFVDSTGQQSHRVKRTKNLVDAVERDIYVSDVSNPILTWSPFNNAADGRKIRLFPKQGRTGTLHIFYIRNAKRLVSDSDVCDIDEFEEYIIRFAKTLAYLKDGDPRAEDLKALEEELKQEIIDTLSDMAPTEENEVDGDMSHYDESVGSC